MSDPKDESARAALEDAPDSRLAERLLARRTHALGVIDVRHTESQYARVMDWLAGRTSLLEHLRSRYGLTEDDRARAPGLAFADERRQARARGADETGGLSAAPGAREAPAAERLFTSVAHVPEDSPAAPAETRRIRRRGVPASSPSIPETRHGADLVQVDARQEAADDRTLEQGRPSSDRTRALQAPSPVKEIPDASAHGAAQTPPALSSLTSSPDESTPARHGRSAVTAETGATATPKRGVQPLARGAELPTEAGENVSTGGAEVGREASKANVLRVAESPGAKPPSREAPPHARRQAAGPGGAQSAGDGRPEGEPVLRRPGHSEGAKAGAAPTLVAKESGVTAVSGETRLPLAQAQEMLAGGPGREGNTSRAQSALPLAAGSNGVGSAAAPLPPAPPAPGVQPAVGRAAAGGVETFKASRARGKAAAVNVERLTEQVSRHLARRLLVERERRGLGRK